MPTPAPALHPSPKTLLLIRIPTANDLCPALPRPPHSTPKPGSPSCSPPPCLGTPPTKNCRFSVLGSSEAWDPSHPSQRPVRPKPCAPTPPTPPLNPGPLLLQPSFPNQKLPFFCFRQFRPNANAQKVPSKAPRLLHPTPPAPHSCPSLPPPSHPKLLLLSFGTLPLPPTPPLHPPPQPRPPSSNPRNPRNRRQTATCLSRNLSLLGFEPEPQGLRFGFRSKPRLAWG